MSITISTKVPEELADRIASEQEEGENRSACVRRLIRAGLRTQESPHTISLPLALMWTGSVAAAAQYATASSVFGPAGLAAILIGLALTYDDVRDRIRPLTSRFTPSE